MQKMQSDANLASEQQLGGGGDNKESNRQLNVGTDADIEKRGGVEENNNIQSSSNLNQVSRGDSQVTMK